MLADMGGNCELTKPGETIYYNDIAIIDKSFGFDSSVEIAQLAIQAADVEANSAEYGVGLVKVMGRNAGHIAMNASLASRDVNLCLVPEFKFDLYGPNGVLEYVVQRLQRKNHCVIVVGEGAGNACRDGGKMLLERGFTVTKDKSGNVYPPDIGSLLKDEIPKYAKEKHGMDITLKYIDPSYLLRAVPAIPSDKHLCSILAQNAVHGAMAGFTNFTCGIVRSVSAYIPIKNIVESKEAIIQQGDRSWLRLMTSTGQSNLLNPDLSESKII
jgi:6-phosphofructokinase 1